MAEPIKIAIMLEDGQISAVMTAGIPVEYVLIDFDVSRTAEEDGDDVYAIPQPDGETAEAYAHTGKAEAGGEAVMQLFRIVEAGPLDRD